MCWNLGEPEVDPEVQRDSSQEHGWITGQQTCASGRLLRKLWSWRRRGADTHRRPGGQGWVSRESPHVDAGCVSGGLCTVATALGDSWLPTWGNARTEPSSHHTLQATEDEWRKAKFECLPGWIWNVFMTSGSEGFSKTYGTVTIKDRLTNLTTLKWRLSHHRRPEADNHTKLVSTKCKELIQSNKKSPHRPVKAGQQTDTHVTGGTPVAGRHVGRCCAWPAIRDVNKLSELTARGGEGQASSRKPHRHDLVTPGRRAPSEGSLPVTSSRERRKVTGKPWGACAHSEAHRSGTWWKHSTPPTNWEIQGWDSSTLGYIIQLSSDRAKISSRSQMFLQKKKKRRVAGRQGRGKRGSGGREKVEGKSEKGGKRLSKKFLSWNVTVTSEAARRAWSSLSLPSGLNTKLPTPVDHNSGSTLRIIAQIQF